MSEANRTHLRHIRRVTRNEVCRQFDPAPAHLDVTSHGPRLRGDEMMYGVAIDARTPSGERYRAAFNFRPDDLAKVPDAEIAEVVGRWTKGWQQIAE